MYGRLKPGTLTAGSPTSDEFRTLDSNYILFQSACKPLSFVSISHVERLDFNLLFGRGVLCHYRYAGGYRSF